MYCVLRFLSYEIPRSHDISQAEKIDFWKIHKLTTIFTQNGPV